MPWQCTAGSQPRLLRNFENPPPRGHWSSPQDFPPCSHFHPLVGLRQSGHPDSPYITAVSPIKCHPVQAIPFSCDTHPRNVSLHLCRAGELLLPLVHPGCKPSLQRLAKFNRLAPAQLARWIIFPQQITGHSLAKTMWVGRPKGGQNGARSLDRLGCVHVLSDELLQLPDVAQPLERIVLQPPSKSGRPIVPQVGLEHCELLRRSGRAHCHEMRVIVGEPGVGRQRERFGWGEGLSSLVCKRLSGRQVMDCCKNLRKREGIGGKVNSSRRQSTTRTYARGDPRGLRGGRVEGVDRGSWRR